MRCRARPNSTTRSASAASLPFTRVEVGPDDIAFLQYTGGTTGVSKGAILLHRNLVANVLQVEAWNEPDHARCRRRPTRLFIVTALPLYHIFALTAVLPVQRRAWAAAAC